MASPDSTPQSAALLDSLFSSFDIHNSGFIDKEQLRHLCKGISLTDDEFETIFAELDTDGDERISKSDFLRGFADANERIGGHETNEGNDHMDGNGCETNDSVLGNGDERGTNDSVFDNQCGTKAQTNNSGLKSLNISAASAQRPKHLKRSPSPRPSPAVPENAG